MDEDHKLIERYLSGDDFAIEEIVMKYQRKIYGLAYRMTSDVEDAKDLTQKTFLNAFSNIKTFRGESSFRTWLYRIAVNSCLNHLGRKDRGSVEIDDSLPSGDPGPVATMIGRERVAEVRRALGSLPERQRTAVVLRVYEGLDVRETASVMGCTEGAVKAHYHHAVKRLRELVGGKEL